MRTQTLLILASLVLAGCDQGPAPDTGAAAPEPAATADDDAPVMAGPGFRLDQPIPQADIDTTLALAAPLAYRAEGDVLLLQVEVGNQGRSALVGEGDMPVQLGAILAGPEGVDKAPGRRDFIRKRLPLIQPGSSATVAMQVPAAEILGMGLQVELVQERAGWFGRQYGQPVLEVGTFQRCEGAQDTLCDASGTPVPTAAAAAPASEAVGTQPPG